jgi:hypothetical protein
MEITWWLDNIHHVNGSHLVAPPLELVMFTDGSKQGWGTICNKVRTNGKWSLQESLLHIIFSKLKGALLKDYQTVSLKMDYSTAVSTREGLAP